MLDTPQIIQTTAQHTASIHLTIPRAQIREVMGPGLREVRAALEAQGIPAAGPWLTYHRRMASETFDFEICVPVETPVRTTGRVKPGMIPARRVARTIYHGGYEALGEAWGEFIDWIEAEGHTPAPDLWECYLTDPGASPDPATWQTQLNRPLVG
jgi:effector-binding domain-containing protein